MALSTLITAGNHLRDDTVVNPRLAGLKDETAILAATTSPAGTPLDRMTILSHMNRRSRASSDRGYGASVTCRDPVAWSALLVLIAMLMLAMPASAAVRLDISGVNEEQATNVRLTVGQPVRQTARSIERYIEGIPELAITAMSALGYYAAEVEVIRLDDPDAPAGTEGSAEALSAAEAAKAEEEEGVVESITTSVSGDDATPVPDAIVAIRITRNNPVRINRVLINITGPARLDGGYMPVIGNTVLRRNAVFVSDDYETTKGVLLDRAQNLGYFDFRFTTSAVRVSRRNLTADIELVAESGPRYQFGVLKFEQSIFAERFLKRWIPFDEGDPYSSDDLGQVTENLQRSGYFSSVRVLPQRDPRYGKTVPVVVRLEGRDDNIVGVGVGFATDVGPRTKLTWERPLMNRFGHSAQAELSISEPRQRVSVSYRIPRGARPLTNYWGIQYGLQNEDLEDTESFLSTLNFERVKRYDSQWNESIFIRWERERSRIGDDPERETDLVLPGISYTRSRSKGAPFPTWGQATTFLFMYGSENLLSTIDFYKSLFTFKYLRGFAEKNAVILSLQYGAIRSNNYPLVPTSQRFFAGGDKSIRGFAYRDVSPRNSEGEATGGRYLEVTSVEYNYRLRDRWAAAVFVDAGRAFNNIDTRYSAGAGVGIRWQSPVGPFRVDVATPISDEDKNSVRLHLSLGPDI